MKDEFNFNPARPNQRQNYMITNFVSNYDDLGRASMDQMIKQVSDEKKIDYLEKSENIGFFQKLSRYLNLTNPVEWIFLTFFAVIISIFLLFLDKLMSYGFEKRRSWSELDNQYIDFILWVGSAVFLYTLATSVGYFITPDADGSGIPEMKTVLSGISIYRYFSFNAFIGKTIGLFAIIVGGPSVGKVGPFVHLSCLICNRLLKINYFSKINRSTSSKNNMLGAASAAGISLALGTPLGGVLFSIESTASIYIVSNIWRSYYCSVICIFVMKIFSTGKVIADIDQSSPLNFNFETIFFIIQGLICGVIGALFSTLVAKIVYIRRKSKLSFLNNRFRYAIIIALIVSLTTFFYTPIRKTDKEIMSMTFSHNSNKLKSVLSSNIILSLLLMLVLKFTIATLCLTMNCPAGLFGPVFAIGAIFGRLFGHVVNSFFTLSDPGIYSLIGAACVFSGVTHTVSSAMIIFEMTGQTSYLAPLLLATLISNLTAQSLSMNMFDVLLLIKNLPHLPSVKSHAMYSLMSNDIMNKVNFYLEMDKLNIINAMNIFSKLPKKYNFVIPILDNNGNICYTVQVKNLFKYTFNEYNKFKLSYNIKNQSNFNEYFTYIRKKFIKIRRGFFEQISYKFKKLYVSLRDRQRLKLNKNFEEESNWRLLTIFNDSN